MYRNVRDYLFHVNDVHAKDVGRPTSRICASSSRRFRILPDDWSRAVRGQRPRSFSTAVSPRLAC